eukprot:15445150-Alexandrium_andersonii.AAC.1
MDGRKRHVEQIAARAAARMLRETFELRWRASSRCCRSDASPRRCSGAPMAGRRRPPKRLLK